MNIADPAAPGRKIVRCERCPARGVPGLLAGTPITLCSACWLAELDERVPA